MGFQNFVVINKIHLLKKRLTTRRYDAVRFPRTLFLELFSRIQEIEKYIVRWLGECCCNGNIPTLNIHSII